MNIIYRLQDVEFEWDSNKAQSNLEKHGITFYVKRSQRTRIISARPATRTERKLYEQA